MRAVAVKTKMRIQKLFRQYIKYTVNSGIYYKIYWKSYFLNNIDT